MPVLAWVKAVHLAATALVTGAFAFELLVLRGIALPAGDSGPARSLRAQLHGLACCGVAAAVLSWVAWLALLAVSMSGLPPAEALTPAVLGTVLARTTFGLVWSWRAGLLVALAVLLLVRPVDRRAPAGWAGAGLALPLACSLAWAGHAAGTSPLHALLDALHLLAACVWLGMLPPLWLVIRRACAAPADAAWPALAAASAQRFSRPGMLAVATLALTGLANALLLVDAPRDLVATPYGEALLAKLAAFALMLGLAAANRWRFTPAAGAGDGEGERQRALRHLRASVLLELALGALVLALVGFLGVTPPGSHDAHGHDMHAM